MEIVSGMFRKLGSYVRLGRGHDTIPAEAQEAQAYELQVSIMPRFVPHFEKMASETAGYDVELSCKACPLEPFIFGKYACNVPGQSLADELIQATGRWKNEMLEMLRRVGQETENFRIVDNISYRISRAE